MNEKYVETMLTLCGPDMAGYMDGGLYDYIVQKKMHQLESMRQEDVACVKTEKVQRKTRIGGVRKTAKSILKKLYDLTMSEAACERVANAELLNQTHDCCWGEDRELRQMLGYDDDMDLY